MGTNFRRLIRDGEIDSIAALQAAFKSAAKASHPDLAGEDGGEDFLRLRRDYEAALAELAAPPAAGGGAAFGEGGEGADGASAFPALRLLLKRGFPKRPRHEKERLRYAYERLRAREALSARDPGAADLFDAAEAELLALRDAGAEDFAPALRLLSEIVAARIDGTEARIAAARMELAGRAGPPALGEASRLGTAGGKRLGNAAAAFFRLLVAW